MQPFTISTSIVDSSLAFTDDELADMMIIQAPHMQIDPPRASTVFGLLYTGVYNMNGPQHDGLKVYMVEMAPALLPLNPKSLLLVSC